MQYDVIIIGSGAAGLMCAIVAAKRGRKVLVIDHSYKIGEKIRISGGGRCNFTNIHASPANYISANPHFCVSALKRYSPRDFIKLVESYGIAYHEKTLGQLFCDESAQQIIDMLLNECAEYGVTIKTGISVKNVRQENDGFIIEAGEGSFTATSVVIATGGPSIPKTGASSWGYELARKFGLKVITPRAALVPFTFEGKTLEKLQQLSGISLDVTATCNGVKFKEAMLFTHRGLSGPAILQISSYWNEGDSIIINLLPKEDAFALLKERKNNAPKQEIQTILSQILPKRLAQYLCDEYEWQGRMADFSHAKLQNIADILHKWQLIPSGTEGYRTAEVAIGGVDTDELSSKTFEAKKVKGLYFIGEVVDVTGHLGGFNFQWAWASGHAAGQFV